MWRSPLTRRRARVYSVLFLIWGISGLAAFVAQRSMNLSELAKHDPLQAHIFATMPQWVWAAYGISVACGLAGAVALLLRRRIALPLFIGSLAAMTVNFGYTFAATDLLAVKGIGAAAFPVFIVLVALLQIVVAGRMTAQGDLR